MYTNKRDFIADVIKPSDFVLDVGFAGQSLRPDSPEYPHNFIRNITENVYGVDLKLPDGFGLPRYFEQSAETFELPITFDVIIALDVIEHLSNPGLFLTQARKHLNPGGRLILSTPNAFGFSHLFEKVMHDEPRVNPDHTCYFNSKTLTVLFQKNGFQPVSWGSMYDMLGNVWTGGWKRKVVGSIYFLLTRRWPKFANTLIVIATPL